MTVRPPVAAPAATLGRRVGAFALDLGIAYAIGGVLTGILIALVFGVVPFADPAVLSLLIVAGSAAVGVLMLAWWLVYSAMQGGRGSIGQRALGVQLRDAGAGAPIGFGRALWRNVVFALGGCIVVGYFSPLFDGSGRHQGWQDKASRAVVVDAKGRDAAFPAPAASQAYAGPAPAVPAQIASAAAVPQPLPAGVPAPMPVASPHAAPAGYAAYPPPAAPAAYPVAAHAAYPAHHAAYPPAAPVVPATPAMYAPPAGYAEPVLFAAPAGYPEPAVVAPVGVVSAPAHTPAASPSPAPPVPPEAVAPTVPVSIPAPIAAPATVALATVVAPAAPAVHPEPAFAPGVGATAVVTHDGGAAASFAPPVFGDDLAATHASAPRPAERAALYDDSPVIAVLTWDDGVRMAVYGRTLYGRNPSSEPGVVPIAVRDETLSMSKTHFEIGGDATAAWIVDRHSTNGTTLVRDGGRIPLFAGVPTTLRAGDVLELGDRRAAVELAR